MNNTLTKVCTLQYHCINNTLTTATSLHEQHADQGLHTATSLNEENYVVPFGSILCKVAQLL